MIETADDSSQAVEEDYQKLSKGGKDILKKLVNMTISEFEGNERFSDARSTLKAALKDHRKPIVSCNQM